MLTLVAVIAAVAILTVLWMHRTFEHTCAQERLATRTALGR